MDSSQVLSDRLLRIAEIDPDRHCVSDQLYGRFTYGQIAAQVDRVAFGLFQRGMRRGDIAILQLPNWVPFLVFHLALTHIGVITRLDPDYLSRERFEKSGRPDPRQGDYSALHVCRT